MQTKMAQNKSNAIDPKQDNNYFEFITLFFISCFILIDFLPQFRSIEIIGPQYIYLSFLNIIIGIYFYKNPEQISIDLIQILKKNYLIKAYLIFLLLSSASIFIAQNISLGIYSISRLFIGLCTLLNLSILLYKRLNLIYTIALIIGLSVFLQSINELYNFIQVAKSESIVDALGHLKGNTGNINIFSASLSIKIPFLLIGIVHFVKQKKWFLILSFLLATTLIFLSGSRSAFLSLTFETTIFLLLFSKIYPSKKIIISTLTTILLPIVLSFLISNFIFKIGKDTGRYQSVTSRVSQITNIKDASVNARLLYWDIAFKMIKEKPLMGIGLGNWLLESIPYERTISNDEIVSGHPHNDFLEIAAETGVLNGLIYFSIFIMALYINFKKIIKEENTEVKIIALLAILLLVSYVIDATFNFPLYRTTMQFGFCLFIALSIVNKVKTTELTGSLISKKTAAFIIIVSLFTSFVSYGTFKAYELENNIGADFLTNKYTLQANSIANNLPKYPNVFTTGEAVATYAGKYFIEEKNYEQALKFLAIGDKINPYLGRTEYYKYIVFNENGQKDSAYYYAKKALDIRPRNKKYYSIAINSAIDLNDTLGILKIHTIYTQYNNTPEVWVNTSGALNQLKYANKSLIAFLDKGLKIFPNDSLLNERKKLFHQNIFELQAIQFGNALKYDKALLSYKKALEAEPGNLIYLQNIGICYYNLKQYDNAIIYLKKALDAPNLNDGKSEYLLGMSYFSIKNNEEGCKYLNLAKNKNYSNAADIVTQNCQ